MIKIDKDVVVTLHKRTATKKVYVRGHLVHVYHRCPHPDQLLFRSDMVNDVNQDLCGGWSRYMDEDPMIVDRVLTGLKPFGNVGFCTRYHDLPDSDLEGFRVRLEHGGCLTRSYIRRLSGGIVVANLDFTLPGTLSDHFDMQALADDYRRFMPHDGTDKQILKYQDIPLSSFLGDRWDNLGWLTGLILGYPVENTMSILGGIE